VLRTVDNRGYFEINAKEKSRICAVLQNLYKHGILNLEAQTGFEPVNQGVADPRLTTWLLRRNLYKISYCRMTPRGFEPLLPP
jgi:hypothetical protein